MIQLFYGSIFNSKCDLIIIPCDSNGGVTSLVYKELATNGLPKLNRHSTAGEVVFIQNTGKFANASMIGYAASVDATTVTSSENILRSILRSIKQCCHEQSLQKINIPLLGTGAGGLSPKVSYEEMKSEFINDSSISLCVYAIDPYTYNELVSDYELISERTTRQNFLIKNPRVFISYAGANIQNREWVRNLACRLRENGVNARLDMFHLKPGQDLPQWMTNELIMADKVLLICDRYYVEKADNKKGGVGWETMIIQGDMLSSQEQSKYIAISREPIDESLPIYVKSKYALDWSEGENFEELLLYLFDCDIEPDIGEIPDFIKEKLLKMACKG